MANAWGELSWNSGLWGQQSDAIATPTGFGLTSALGEEESYNTTGWGRYAWGELSWGAPYQNATASVTGQQLNLNTGNVGISGEINAGWGRLTWGENAWGIQGDVLITGIGVSAGIGTGSVTIDVQPELTGEQLNLSTGSVIALGTTTIYQDGIGLTISQGEETVDLISNFPVNGIGLTANLGTVDSYNEAGWGRDDWGTEVWGAQGIWETVSVTGNALSVSSGEQEAWGELTWGTYEWGGIYVTDVDIKTYVDVTGQGLTAAEGTVDPSPDATVLGIGLTAGVALGSVIEADANVSITGIGLEIAQGTAELDAVTFASPTGQQLNTSLNSVVAGASAEVDPTGLQANIALGNENIQSWQIVDTGSTVSYSEVSTGTSVTWNDIDTAA